MPAAIAILFPKSLGGALPLPYSVIDAINPKLLGQKLLGGVDCQGTVGNGRDHLAQLLGAHIAYGIDALRVSLTLSAPANSETTALSTTGWLKRSALRRSLISGNSDV